MPRSREQILEQKTAEQAAKIIVGILLLLIALVVHSCEKANHRKQIDAGNWQEFTLFVCSLQQVMPTTLQDWDAVETWLQTAKITLQPTDATLCVAVPATFDQTGTQKGDFETVTISWEVKSYKVGDHVRKTKAIPTVAMAQAEVNWDTFENASWKSFPYDWGREVGRTFSITAPRAEVFPDSTIFHYLKRVFELYLRSSTRHSPSDLLQ
jgi:hypothetical protein